MCIGPYTVISTRTMNICLQSKFEIWNELANFVAKFTPNFRTWQRNWQVRNELGNNVLKSYLKSTITTLSSLRTLTLGHLTFRTKFTPEYSFWTKAEEQRRDMDSRLAVLSNHRWPKIQQAQDNARKGKNRQVRLRNLFSCSNFLLLPE
jgi:hypothetical protein